MKKLVSILIVVLLCVTATIGLCACDKKEVKDYVSMLHFNGNTDRKHAEATVKMFIDGDTTHFYIQGDEASNFENGVLKARYLGVDTPESTGAVEEYGKQASNFTHDKLASANSIIVESDTDTWDTDSTDTRYLVWIWYQPEADAPYRLLNLELLQEGLARLKNADDTSYEQWCVRAYDQAIDHKIKIFSGKEDPLYYYGAFKEVTVKQLRLNAEDYLLQRVGFEATVAYKSDESKALFVFDYDEEDKIAYGFYIYYGYSLGSGFNKLVAGNRLHFVGTVGEFGGAYQITDIRFDPYMKDEEEKKNFFQVISTNNEVTFQEVTGVQYNGNVTIDVSGDATTLPFVQVAERAPISLSNLTVKSVYTTNSDTSSNGAMTLTCQTPDGQEVQVRTVVLYEGDSSKNPMITADAYNNKTINVKGFIEYYQPDENDASTGRYQIKVLSCTWIEVIE